MISRRRLIESVAAWLPVSWYDSRGDRGAADAAGTRPVFTVATDAGAVGDGRTADRTALAAAAASSATLAFGPGTYRIESDWSVPPTCSLLFFGGAVLKIDAGKTVTINGPFSAGLQRVFDTTAVDSAIVFGASSVQAVHPEWWYDGSGDFHDAILAAMRSIPRMALSGVPVRFSARLYHTRALGVPVRQLPGSSQPRDRWFYAALRLEGIGGGGATYRPTLRFIDSGDPATVYLDFSDARATAEQVVVENLQLEWGGGAATANAGVGLRFANLTHGELRDVWVTGFNVGVECAGQTFYGSFDSLKCVGNYSAGFRGVADSAGRGFTLNGTPFNNCMFSGTRNGPGFHVENGGSAAVSFNNCWFESNRGVGCSVSRCLNVKLDSCYFEYNRGYHLYAPNTYPADAASVLVLNCYFDVLDPNASDNVAAIRGEGTRWDIQNCWFYSDPPLPPVFQASADVTALSFARNNTYTTASFTNGHDHLWTIDDAKHPRQLFTNGTPSGQKSLQVGAVLYNTDPASMNSVAAYQVRTPGASGVADPDVLASTAQGSSRVRVSDANHTIGAGEHIAIAGVTFGSPPSQWAVIRHVYNADGAPVLELDVAANHTVKNQRISYRVAALQQMPAFVEGTWTPRDDSGAGLPFVAASGRYVRVGSMVTCWASLTYPATSDRRSASVGGLPLTPQIASVGYGAIAQSDGGGVVSAVARAGSTSAAWSLNGATATNAQMSRRTVHVALSYITTPS